MLLIIGVARLSVVAQAATPVPAVCVASGQTTLTFASDFAGGHGDFDTDMTYHSGFHWYRWNFLNVKPDPARSYIKPGGGLVVSAHDGGFQGHVTSAARIAGAPGFVGTAFGGGACIAVTLRFKPDRQASLPGHPSFWTMSLEHLLDNGADQWPGMPQAYKHFVEWDIFEYYKAPEPQFLSSWIDWYGYYILEKGNSRAMRGCVRPYCKKAGSFVNNVSAFPNGLDWNNWQQIIGLWVPKNSTQHGYIQVFLNGRPISVRKEWDSMSKSAMREEALLNFSSLDSQHQVLVISSGSLPMEIASVNVWQKNADSNMHN